MPAKVTCPHCHLVLKVPSDFAGQRVKCPQCEQRFVVAPAGHAPATTATRSLGETAAVDEHHDDSFADLVVSLLTEEEDAAQIPADAPHVKQLTGPSHFWRCPKCQALWQKKLLATALLESSRIRAQVRCETCGAAFDYHDVEKGKLDAPEMEVVCTHCHTQFTGPADDLLGQPCPACHATLPK